MVEDPGRSSPGLQFLATTVAYFGEGGWQDFWRALRENDVEIAGGWSEAYYSSFSVYGGDRPIVVSYTSSPAAEVFFAETPIDEPPTLNVIARLPRRADRGSPTPRRRAGSRSRRCRRRARTE